MIHIEINKKGVLMKFENILLCSLMISTVNAVVTVIKMPSEYVLTTELDEGGFKHFRENSPIVKRLAGFWISESQAKLRTEDCFAFYIKSCEVGSQDIQRTLLLKIVLKDFLRIKQHASRKHQK